MSILDRLEQVVSEDSSAKDIGRISYIKKTLNLQECDKIKDVSDEKIKKAVELHGTPMRVALERYAAISEDTNEKERIKRVLGTPYNPK